MIKDPERAVRASSLLFHQAAEMGIDLSINFDFNRYEHVRGFAAMGARPSAVFDPKVTHLSANNSFWVMGRNKNGDPVHFQAFRTCHMEEPFHIAGLRWFCSMHHIRGQTLEPKNYIVEETPLTRCIEGHTVYHGEIWMAPELRSPTRRLGPIDVVMKVGMLWAYLKWHPACIWGISSDINLKQGAAARMGYSQAELSFVDWQKRPEGWGQVEGLAVAQAGDLEHLIAVLTRV